MRTSCLHTEECHRMGTGIQNMKGDHRSICFFQNMSPHISGVLLPVRHCIHTHVPYQMIIEGRIFSPNPVRPPCNCPPTRASGRRGARNNLRLAEAFRLTDEPQEVLARERENERKIGFCVHFSKIHGIWQLFSRFVTLKIVEGLQTRNGICPFLRRIVFSLPFRCILHHHNSGRTKVERGNSDGGGIESFISGEALKTRPCNYWLVRRYRSVG